MDKFLPQVSSVCHNAQCRAAVQRFDNAFGHAAEDSFAKDLLHLGAATDGIRHLDDFRLARAVRRASQFRHWFEAQEAKDGNSGHAFDDQHDKERYDQVSLAPKVASIIDMFGGKKRSGVPEGNLLTLNDDIDLNSTEGDNGVGGVAFDEGTVAARRRIGGAVDAARTPRVLLCSQQDESGQPPLPVRLAEDKVTGSGPHRSHGIDAIDGSDNVKAKEPAISAPAASDPHWQLMGAALILGRFYAEYDPSKTFDDICSIVRNRMGCKGWTSVLEAALRVKYGDAPNLEAGLEDASRRAREAHRRVSADAAP